MNTKQLVVRSAVTLVATGLTLLSSGTCEANGRGPSGMRMSGSRGGINNGAIRQSISNRAMNRGNGTAKTIGRSNSGRLSGRDDRGGRGERQRGDDRGRGEAASTRERGDDHGRQRERGDDHGRNGSVTRGEREPGDDHGGRGEREREHRHGEREPGDDHGRL